MQYIPYIITCVIYNMIFMHIIKLQPYLVEIHFVFRKGMFI